MNRPHRADQANLGVILPEEIDWKPFPALPPAARLAIVVGHPTEPGPYVIGEKAPGGTKLMPHKHSEDRMYRVVSGVFYIALGETLDGDKVKAYPPGSVIALPGEAWHFHWAESGEYVTEITGMARLASNVAICRRPSPSAR